MRIYLECQRLFDSGGEQALEILSAPVAGLPLIQRHLLTLSGHSVALTGIPEQWLEPVRKLLARSAPTGMDVTASSQASLAFETVLKIEVDTLVDPRLIDQLLETGANSTGSLVCVDEESGNYSAQVKSPYQVGVPQAGEAKELPASSGTSHFPIGVSLHKESRLGTSYLHVGRYYWHRLTQRQDSKEATTKVFLATMKPTDGIYARTNRRVSLKISRLLAPTSITPNMVTLFTLLVSGLGGWLFSLGWYGATVAGSLTSWFACMLDGVDGELARAKFKSSAFGCWLEMLCDYLYYVFLFVGVGLGLEQATGNQVWFYLGLASASASVLSFVVIAIHRRQFSHQAPPSKFGQAFQESLERRASNPLYQLARLVVFLPTRAALPYYVILFTVAGLLDWFMVLSFIGTTVTFLSMSYFLTIPITLSSQLKRDS